MDAASLSKSANQFAVDLFQCYLRRHGDKYSNLLISPYLIYHSLAMMLVGAKGQTAKQLQSVLRMPGSYNPPTSASSSAPNRPVVFPSGLYNPEGPHLSPTNGRRVRSNPSLASRLNLSSDGHLVVGSNRSSSHTPLSSSSSRSSLSEPNPSPTVETSIRNRESLNNNQTKSNNGATHLKESSKASRALMAMEEGEEARHKEFLWLSEQLLHGNHEFVHLASFLYLDKGTKRIERFKAILRDYYETKPKKIDFENVDLMIKTVNEDVARTTENIYNDILSRQEAQKLDKSYMLLVNAVFFRGFWLSNFTDVKKASFVKYPTKWDAITKHGIGKAASIAQQAAVSANDGSHSTQELPQMKDVNDKTPMLYNVNMMSKLDYLPIVNDEQLDARIVRLPFEASDLQMLLILPNNKQSDPSYLCEKISALKIAKIVEQFGKCKYKTVKVSMPVFCIDSGKISIQSTLVEMGASDLFDKSKANMSGVCENKQVWLHKILHRCFIICDNRGSITSRNFEKAKRRQQAQLVSGVANGRDGVEDFVADHPFMYIIMDSVTKAILMMGLYTNPSETLEVIHENQLSAEEAHQIYTEGVYKS